MITYKIIVSGTSDRPADVHKYTQYKDATSAKEYILNRALSNNKFEEGSRVKIRRGHRRGTVRYVHNKVDDINWQGKLPMFLEVKFDDGVVMMCHYSQLKRSK